MPDSQSLLLLLTSGLIVAGCALPVLILALLSGSRRWFPRRRPWPAEWNGFAVVFCFLFYYYLQPFVLALIVRTGFLDWLYGPDFLPKTAVGDSSPERIAAMTIASQWAGLFAFPFLTWGILAILKTGGPNGWLPVSRSRMSKNLGLGYLFWLVITPICFSVFLLANLLFVELFGHPPEKHPATLFAPLAGTREWILFSLQVGLVAPTLEELLFRGAVLPWLLQRSRRRHRSPEVLVPDRHRATLVFVAAVAVALAWQSNLLGKAIRERDGSAVADGLTPPLFILSLGIPLYLLPRWKWLGQRLRLRSSHQGKAIISSAILFAAVHATWPTPAPLFVLALALGYLAVRTRNIAGPIFLHSLFNAVSVVYLLRGGTN